MNKTQEKSQEKSSEALSAAVQVLPLPVGLYLFSVRAATPSRAAAVGNLALPAINVALGPGMRSEQVEFVGGPGANGAWLFAQGDMLVAKVSGTGAILVVTSIRAPGGEALSINVERLEARVDSGIMQAAAQSAERGPQTDGAGESPVVAVAEGDGLPVRVITHIRTRGDRTFANVAWAGRAGRGMWIESFSLQPLKTLDAKDIEYKGLTANGFETPWISDDLMCGTKGMGVPLIGFAVRLKRNSKTTDYDCEYSGYFESGTIAGPFRNGTPCRSTVANDPLEGIQLRVVKRSPAAVTEKELAGPAIGVGSAKLAAYSGERNSRRPSPKPRPNSR